MRCSAGIVIVVLVMLISFDGALSSEPQPSAGAFEISYVGSCLWTGIRDVAIKGDYAYCIFPCGLVVLDINDKSQPSFVARLFTSGSDRSLAIRGNFAYVADANEGLHIIDISEPAAPRLVAGCDAAGEAFDIALFGDYALIADFKRALRIIDISDPASPVLIGSSELQGRPQKVTPSGDLALLGCYDAGSQLIDISDPATPVAVDSLNIPEQVNILSLSGSLAFAADRTTLWIYDLADITAPVQLSACALPEGWPTYVTVQGQYTYVVAMGPGYDRLTGLGFHVIDISDTRAPSIVGFYTPWGDIAGLTVSGDFAYVRVDERGLDIVDISDPTAPVLVGQYETRGEPAGVAVSGNYAYIAGSFSGLQIVSISDPATPEPVGEIRPPKSDRPTVDQTEFKPTAAVDVDISGSYVCVADKWRGIHVIDVSEPTTPVLTGTCSGLFEPQRIDISGTYVHIAVREQGGLQIVDISDPKTPSIAGQYENWDLMFHTGGVCVSDNIAWVVANGLIAVDISNPNQPLMLAHCELPRYARDVVVLGDYAYVANERAGMSVVDLSDPGSPVVIGTFDTPGEARAIAVSGDYAYVADYWAGVKVFDVSTPAESKLVASFDTPYLANDIAVVGDYVYVADGAGFLILRGLCTTDPQK